MEQYNKLKETFTKLDGAIEKVKNAKDQKELNEADNEIGATLRAIQYGVGMVGIECKQLVDAKRRGGFTKVEEPVISKTEQRKEEVVKKETKKKRTKKGKK